MDSKFYLDLVDRFNDYNTDKTKKTKLHGNLGHWLKNMQRSLSQFSDVEAMRSSATAIMDKAVYNLDNLLFTFEDNFTRNGFKLIYVPTGKDVAETVNKIIKEKGAKNILINSNTITDEFGIADIVNKGRKISNETNSDNIIADMEKKNKRNGVRNHQVLQAVNCNAEDALSYLKAYNDTEEELPKNETLNMLEEKVDSRLKNIDMFISGVNFLVSETGSMVLSDNEGAAPKARAFAKTKIYIATINQVINRLYDLETLLPVYSTFATGQRNQSRYTIISGTDKADNETYLIITDIKRIQELMDNNTLRSALRCINCGACTNVCPIYRAGSGELFGNAYPGPYGFVLYPMIKSLTTYSDLAYMCTLCGKCNEVCPVNIKLTDLILGVRKRIVEAEEISTEDKKFIANFFGKTIKRKLMNRNFRSFLTSKDRQFKRLADACGGGAMIPPFSKKNFSEQYVEKTTKNK